MKYSAMVPGIFLSRPNRFIAHVQIGGQEQICHVKNTGRCKELLVPGAAVWCEESSNPARKTKYDLIAVQKGGRLINMDSQAPNAAVRQWLQEGGMGAITELKPEYTHGSSRFDFFFRKDGIPCLMEVKGVTLENDGICAFPDAPTQRGARHLHELADAQQKGYRCFILFVIQMDAVQYLHPNDRTDPAFGTALRAAAAAGVQVMAYDCTVTPDSMVIGQPLPVQL